LTLGVLVPIVQRASWSREIRTPPCWPAASSSSPEAGAAPASIDGNREDTASRSRARLRPDPSARVPVRRAPAPDEFQLSKTTQQFENPANPAIHREATAQEILRDFPDGVDFFISGVGTGGHITGVSEALKERFPNMQTFAVEPAKSAVISGGEPGPHRLQGIGAGFVPANLHSETLDGVITVSEEDAYAYAVRSAREEGIFVGPSSGAALAAVAQKLPDIPNDSTVLTFCYDTGERYFSVEGLFGSDGTAVQVGDRD
jgi:cysteine synthase